MHVSLQRRDLLTGMLGATAALALTRTALAQPLPPGAVPTQAYLAMATRGGVFLETTARDAYGKTGNPAVRAFARAEVNEQVALADRIGAYTGNAPVPGAGAAGPSAQGPGGLIGAPLAIAAGATNAATGLVGGALGAVAGGRPGQASMTSDAQKAQIEAQLAAQQPGPAYDAAFVNASLQGHLEAQAIHGSYAQSGEDPGLRRIARSTLPLIGKHIAVLSRLQTRLGGNPG